MAQERMFGDLILGGSRDCNKPFLALALRAWRTTNATVHGSDCMIQSLGKNRAASIRAHLLDLVKAGNFDSDQVLVRFAVERFLYRLGHSPYADRFMLKGALLFAIRPRHSARLQKPVH